MQQQVKIFEVTENGFSMTSNKVQVPACKIKATHFIEAADILSKFLSSGVKPDEIELITPMERIEFEK